MYLFYRNAEIRVRPKDDGAVFNHSLATILVEYASAVSIVQIHSWLAIETFWMFIPPCNFSFEASVVYWVLTVVYEQMF